MFILAHERFQALPEEVDQWLSLIDDPKDKFFRSGAGNPCHEPAGSPDGGQFCPGDGGGSEAVTLEKIYKGQGVSDKFVADIHKAINSAGNAKFLSAIANTGVGFYTIKSPQESGMDSRVMASYSRDYNIIELYESKLSGRSTVEQAHYVAHEIGHAIDYKYRLSYGSAVRDMVARDVAKQSAKDQKRFAYYKNRAEAVAEATANLVSNLESRSGQPGAFRKAFPETVKYVEGKLKEHGFL